MGIEPILTAWQAAVLAVERTDQTPTLYSVVKVRGWGRAFCISVNCAQPDLSASWLHHSRWADDVNRCLTLCCKRTVRPMISSCWCDQITRRASRPCLDSTESCIRPSGGCRITAFEPRHIHIMAPNRDTVNRLLQNRNIYPLSPWRCPRYTL